MLVVVVSSTVLTAGCDKKSGAVSDEDYVVEMAFYGCDHMLSGPVAVDAGIFEELGLKVNATKTHIIAEPLAAGTLDCAYIWPDAVAFAREKGAKIFVAANNHKYGSYYLVCSNDITDPKELVGKKIALETDPHLTSPWWCEWTDSIGIPRDPEAYQGFAGMTDANEYLALKTGELDAYVTCDPYGSYAEYDNVGWIAGVAEESMAHVCCNYAMSEKFATEHPELAKKMLLAHTRAMEYVYLHPAKAAEIFAEWWQVPIEVAYMTVYKKTVYEGRSLCWEIEKQDFEDYVAWGQQLGMLDFDKYPEFESYVDTTLLEQCGADDFETFIRTKVDPVFPVGMSYEDWKAKALEIN